MELTEHDFQTLRAGQHHIGLMCTNCGLFVLVNGWAKHLCEEGAEWPRIAVP